MELGCFIIHLERATLRLPQVNLLMAQLPFSPRVIAAIDGSSLTEEQAAHYQSRLLRPAYPFRLRPAEIATFLSHRTCWQTIVNEGLDAALIVEDDVAIDQPVFFRALDTAMAHLAPGDLVRFPIKRRERAAAVLSASNEPRLIRPKGIGLGMVTQIVTRDAAAVLLAKTERFDRPVDVYLQLQWEHRLRVLSVWPCGVREISAEVGGSLIGSHKALRDRLHRELLRPPHRLHLWIYRKLKARRQ